MNSITKKQATLSLVVVAFAAIMIAGTIAASTSSVFAWRSHNHHHNGNQHNNNNSAKTSQGISQSCHQNSHQFAVSGGAATNANVPICLNGNTGSNIAGTSQSR